MKRLINGEDLTKKDAVRRRLSGKLSLAPKLELKILGVQKRYLGRRMRCSGGPEDAGVLSSEKIALSVEKKSLCVCVCVRFFYPGKNC